MEPFSDKGEGKAIGLYTSFADRYVYGAAVKHQCSRDYFYGRDGAMESHLCKLESRYAAKVREIVAAGQTRPALAFEWMQLFWCVQWARTEAAAEQARSMAVAMAQVANHAGLASPPEDERWVSLPMGAISRAHLETEDLAHVVLRNRTAMPFVTSDNPAVVTNRFRAVEPRLRDGPAGLGSAGAILFLPITPSHAIMWYDRDVYSVKNQNGWYDIKNEKDVAAINQHQILNCICNVYFSASHNHEWIREEFEVLSCERKKSLWKQRFGVLEGRNDGVERYRFIKGVRGEEHRRGLIVVSAVPRYPTLWPTFLCWHLRGVAFDTGTAAGFVRQAFLERNPLMSARAVRIKK